MNTQELRAKLEELYREKLPLRDRITTEESTKDVLIRPFLRILGYDDSNPLELTSEYSIPIAKNKSGRVDYTLLKDGKPTIIIECKPWTEKVDTHRAQLNTYFSLLPPSKPIGLLTNGFIYKFFADIDAVNVMDQHPFLTIDLAHLDDTALGQLLNFQKTLFDKQRTLNSIRRLRYTQAIGKALAEQLATPSADLVKLLVTRAGLPMLPLDELTDYTEQAIAAQLKKSRGEDEKEEEKVTALTTGDGRIFYLKRKRCDARGYYLPEEGFIVLAGSAIMMDTAPSLQNKEEREQLLKKSAEPKGEYMVLKEDVKFRTPSGAAIFCNGRPTNGWMEWQDEEGRTLEAVYPRDKQ
jgi:hypothetical protein